MAIIGYYYLHENGDLIYKPGSESVADMRDSDFVRGIWALDQTRRDTAWQILVEAGAAGANPDRIKELAARWKCDSDDAQYYARGLDVPLGLDGDAWCATRSDFINLQESPAGFGKTALEALIALAKDLGYRPSKMWGVTFADLTKVEGHY